MIFEAKFQIGKNGISLGTIEAINSSFKTHTQLRISVLKSLGRDKIKIKQIAEELCEKASYHCHYKIIGFTIILRRQSKKQNHRDRR